MVGVLVSTESFLGKNSGILREDINLIKELKENGYKLAILTNCSRESIEIIERESAKSFFDVIVFSGEIGFEKPQKEAYEITLSRLGVHPKETIFIDDLKRNVLGANAVGMRGLLYKNNTDLRSSLFDLGIKINK